MLDILSEKFINIHLKNISSNISRKNLEYTHVAVLHMYSAVQNTLQYIII